MTSGVKALKPGGKPVISTRTSSSKPSIRSTVTVNSLPPPGLMAGLILEIGKLKTGVGSLRHPENSADFALHVHELRQFHLLPVLDAHGVGVRINGPEDDMRIAHRLKEKPLDRFAIRIKHFDF